MLASLADAPLDDPQLVYEPKYDGIRAIAEIAAEGRGAPLVAARQREDAPVPGDRGGAAEVGARRKQPVVLDGEIVALDAKGEPTGFQQLQGRIHLDGRRGGRRGARSARRSRSPVPPCQRLRRLHRLRHPARRRAPTIAIGRCSNGARRSSASSRSTGIADAPDQRAGARRRPRAVRARRSRSGWEGLIAKHADSLYKSGKRTPDWRKLKIVHEQEFVVGGWTEPRQTRAYFGALLLGVYDAERDLDLRRAHRHRLQRAELARVMKLLKPLETNECPFTSRPKTNERPHWVRPELVAQIKFTEWTADGKLRHPVYLGLRDDKKPTDVQREETRGWQPRLRQVSERRTGQSTARTPRSDRRRTRNREPGDPAEPGPRRTLVDQLTRRSRRRAATARSTLPDGDTLDGHQSAQGVLAEAEADQGRSVPLLRRASRRTSCRRSPIGRW